MSLAVAGAALAKTQELITTGQALFTLTLLAVLVVLSSLVALASELAVGRQAVETFRDDAEGYREALSRADVDTLKTSASLTKAEQSLADARTLVLLIHACVLAATVLATLLLPTWQDDPSEGGRSGSATSTVGTSTGSGASATNPATSGR